MYYVLNCCVNNDHGVFTGRIDGLDVDSNTNGSFETHIQLRPHIFDEEEGEWLGVPFTYEYNHEDRIVAATIDGLRLRVRSSVRSGGNWSWIVFRVALNDIFRLLNHLKFRRHCFPTGHDAQIFDCDQADDSWWNRWKDPTRRFIALDRNPPAWFRALSRKRRRHVNRQIKRNHCLRYRL